MRRYEHFPVGVVHPADNFDFGSRVRFLAV